MRPKNTRKSIDHQKMGTWENRVESYKFAVFPKVNIRKRSKKLRKCFVFKNPKKALEIKDQDLWRLQKTRHISKNLTILPKQNN
jgi:hypothetical protein